MCVNEYRYFLFFLADKIARWIFLPWITFVSKTIQAFNFVIMLMDLITQTEPVGQAVLDHRGNIEAEHPFRPEGISLFNVVV